MFCDLKIENPTNRMPGAYFSLPPYTPNLAPSDFNLFTRLKQFWGGMCTGSSEEDGYRPVQWSCYGFLQYRHAEAHHTIPTNV
jgi:hypothetical protein